MITQKKMIWREIGVLDVENTATKLISILQSYINNYGDNVRIEKKSYGMCEEYYAVEHQVEETDPQYEERLANEKRWEAQKELKEIQELKRLLNKFGSESV